ncbi:MAG: hypothetical protein QM695_09465 [Micropruina sp.]
MVEEDLAERSLPLRGQRLRRYTDRCGADTTTRRRLRDRGFASMFPWMPSLSLAYQKACANDLASSAHLEMLVADLRSWKETAAAVVAGYRDIELEWLD